MSHFDRERILERVVHALGAGAHGYFEAHGVAGNLVRQSNDRTNNYTQAGER